jgi:hypothetical protein
MILAPRLLCIDVFGAAVLRTVASAADVFSFAAREFAWRYALPATGLADARREAERRASAAGRPLELQGIYALLPTLCAAARDGLQAAECDVEVAVAAAHPRTRAQIADASIPVAFIDAGPLPTSTLTRVLTHAGYRDAALFPSVRSAAFDFGVPPTEVQHLAGQPRTLEPSGLGEAESLCQGLIRRFDAGQPDAAVRFGYAVLGPRLGAQATSAIDSAQLDLLDPALVDAGVRAFLTDYAAVAGELPWLQRSSSVASLGGRQSLSVGSASAWSPAHP